MTATMRANDGRHLRSVNNRRRIIDAYLALRDEGVEPSAAQVAARAGVTLRTPFRHFTSMAGLAQEALIVDLDRRGVNNLDGLDFVVQSRLMKVEHLVSLPRTRAALSVEDAAALHLMTAELVALAQVRARWSA